jgi:hypothetical protein
MDRDVAGSVFKRWDLGLPVFEGTLYKAAQVLGVDPELALTEARFYTHLDRAFERGGPFTSSEREYFSIASGFDPSAMEKTAEAYGFDSPDALIVRALRRRDFSPDLEKLALFPGPSPDGATSGVAGADQNGGVDSTIMAQLAGGEAVGPQAGAQLQQNPTIRPTPTAPEQMPPSPEGNFQSLLGDASQAPGAAENGGFAPSGTNSQQQPTPDAATRLQSAVPGIPPDAIERYVPKLEELEQQVGMTIMDPKQIEKFVKEMQKADKKIIDEAIKQYSAQQSQETGTSGSPSGWDATAPRPNGVSVDDQGVVPLPGQEKVAALGVTLAHITCR